MGCVGPPAGWGWTNSLTRATLLSRCKTASFSLCWSGVPSSCKPPLTSLIKEFWGRSSECGSGPEYHKNEDDAYHSPKHLQANQCFVISNKGLFCVWFLASSSNSNDFNVNLLESDGLAEATGEPRTAAAAWVDAKNVTETAETTEPAADCACPSPKDNVDENDMCAATYEPDEETLEDEADRQAEAQAGSSTGEPITYRDRIFLVIQCISTLLHVVVAVWILTAPTNSGIFAQVAFLDTFLLSFQGETEMEQRRLSNMIVYSIPAPDSLNHSLYRTT